MVTTGFYANRTEFFSFLGGQRDFERRIASLHIAASLALRTVVKQHALAPMRRRRFDRTSLF
jgi:hypothetical protein